MYLEPLPVQEETNWLHGKTMVKYLVTLIVEKTKYQKSMT